MLYFLHADARPPAGFVRDIRKYLAAGKPVGCYRFAYEKPPHPLMRLNAYCTRFDRLWCRGGDQSLFVTRAVYDDLGGFREDHQIMEDFEFIQRAQARYPFQIMPRDIIVSARKYITNGYFRVQIANLIVFSMYRMGASQDRLKNTYERLLDYR